MEAKVKFPPNWKIVRFLDVLDYYQPTDYIVNSTQYDDNYNIPVLTPGKSFIIGYTNETKGIFTAVPVIIFDDFTTATKFVNFPFKVKSSAMKILSPKDKDVNIKFVYYYMQTVRVKSETHKRYWISEYSKRSFLIPSPEEQQQIVDKIEELFSKLDAGKRQLETVRQQLKTYRQAVLKSAFEGKFSNNRKTKNGNPLEWDILKLADIGEIVSGGTPSTKEPEYWDGDIPWITPADLSGYSQKYIQRGRRLITKKGLSKSSARLIPFGSVLLSSRAPIGYVAIAKNDLCTNQGFKSIVPNRKVTSEYLYYYLKAYTHRIIEKASGTTFKEVSMKALSSIEIVLPLIMEQEIIVAEIEGRLSICDKLDETIETCLQQTEALKQSILKQAFEGKLVKLKTN